MTDFNDLVDRIHNKSVAVFGEDEGIVYTPEAGGGPFDIEGIFESNPKIFDLNSNTFVETNQPQVDVKEDALDDIPLEDDLVVIRSINYKVVSVSEGGRGMIRLGLRQT